MSVTTINTINLSTPFLIGVPNSRISPEWVRMLNSVVSSSAKVTIVDDVTSNATEYPAFSTGISGLNSLYTSSTKWTFNPSTGLMTCTQYKIGGGSAAQVGTGMYGVSGTSLSFAVNGAAAGTFTAAGLAVQGSISATTTVSATTSITAGTGFGCNGATAQTAVASGGTIPVGGTGSAAGGWDTAAHRDAAIAVMQKMLAALIANGIMS